MEPAHRFSTAFVVKRGYASFKQDGLIAMWNKRWIVLREDQLSWHRSEVKPNEERARDDQARHRRICALAVPHAIPP